ncbi:thioredoxin family protein [Microbispora catharanthi]|uniref:Thiol reductase thioredoxin n=1 Tax=Microbispora catharanthi TaxID=1712871 RepID=A0A5N6BLC2_9ACTN|nr:thioredoxin family protein [Microbispora catharanthi]KAB8180853.1 thiol reductase thioredoxin [Microbispora catharanthi]
MLRRIGPAAAIGIALLLTGCANKDTSTATASAPATSSSASSSSATPTPSAAAADTIPDHYDPARDPAADLKTALTLAASDGKKVLIDFGADWCPDCKVLDKLFQSKQTKPLLQRNYHLVAVDVGEFDRNLDFAAKYVKLETSGIPALVVLAPGGRVLVHTNDGSFANARTMNSHQVNAFLTRWASKS